MNVVHPWTTEPDEKTWACEETGLTCQIKRNGMGTWCGYVALPSSHPFANATYDFVDRHVDVHGGLTYSGKGPGGSSVFGFDCAHAEDLKPVLWEKLEGRPEQKLFLDETYRDMAFVIQETESLALQLKKLG